MNRQMWRVSHKLANGNIPVMSASNGTTIPKTDAELLLNFGNCSKLLHWPALPFFNFWTFCCRIFFFLRPIIHCCCCKDYWSYISRSIPKIRSINYHFLQFLLLLFILMSFRYLTLSVQYVFTMKHICTADGFSPWRLLCWVINWTFERWIGCSILRLKS